MLITQIIAKTFIFYLLMVTVLTACIASAPPDSALPSLSPTEAVGEAACPITEPAWLKPPEDAAVSNAPEYGHYFANKDRSILASAGWIGLEKNYLRAGEAGIKIGWFRPAGAELAITGQRVDGPAPPLEAHVPCCYPTQFQASGLIFPAAGCWEVTARAADSELSFVVRVDS